MSSFLANNHDVDRAMQGQSRAASQHGRNRRSTQQRRADFSLATLQRMLEAEESDESGESLRISGASGGGALSVSEIGVTATAHGKELRRMGFSVDQVVHDYGDLCQAITDLAFERDAPFSVDEFRTLNRCPDNAIAIAIAIASAASAFSLQRDAGNAARQDNAL